ncbi:MAG: hypothetical protein KDB14_08740 [Planctomycetales bacterium]|nr:hypothetical protein [Planctomycetales bacterium]
MTFVELLVAMALSMILIYGMVAAFGRVGREASDGRARIEMANQLRNVINRLNQDLEGATAPVRNWNSPTSGAGYFEAIEGPRNMRTGLGAATQVQLFDDIDDVLMFTSRNDANPFRGRIVDYATGNVNYVTSPTAEVIWAATPITAPLGTDSDPRDFYIYRRAMLVLPSLNGANGFVHQAVGTLPQLMNVFNQFITGNDLSVRMSLQPDASGNYRLRIIANRMEDLAARENRFGHRLTVDPNGNALVDNSIREAFPHSIYVVSGVAPNFTYSYNPAFLRLFANTDAVLMSHVVAFDIKFYDPSSPGFASAAGSEMLTPADPGFYTSVDRTTLLGRGNFVDLGYAVTHGTVDVSHFSSYPHPKSGLRTLAAQVNVFTYDSWSNFYETNGQDEDRDGVTDEGADGIDVPTGTPGVGNGIDSFDEHETAPPYGSPPRGIKVTVRLYESDTRQIRQMSAMSDFIPE